MHTVVILSSLTKGTGNKTTAQRIASYVESTHRRVILRSPKDFASVEEWGDFLKREKVSAIVAIHVFRCLPYLKACCNIPYILIFGGTDVNVQTSRDVYQSCKTVVENARFLVAFSTKMRERALTLWSCLQEKEVKVIVQGVTVNAGSYTFETLFQDNQVDIDRSELLNALLVEYGRSKTVYF